MKNVHYEYVNDMFIAFSLSLGARHMEMIEHRILDQYDETSRLSKIESSRGTKLYMSILFLKSVQSA